MNQHKDAAAYSHGGEADQSRQSSQLKHREVPHDKAGERQHVHQIVTTRGEGLTDLLGMKRDFERHITKVSICFTYPFGVSRISINHNGFVLLMVQFGRLIRRVEEIEKGKSPFCVIDHSLISTEIRHKI